ncbi:MAG: DUF4281 domain-containing protein [Proteobacteria bacterium]|nr:DUF4281 domain-containing protein [Pseudomonadota bacterium]
MGELSYLLANASVIPVWILMIGLPGSDLTRRLVNAPWLPLLYAVLYSALLFGSLAIGGDGDMFSMANLRVSFERDVVLLLAWVHYLCFDMFVGMWEVRDARRHGIGQVWLAPCLLFTLLFGPFGFALYCLVRWRLAGVTRFE